MIRILDNKFGRSLRGIDTVNLVEIMLIQAHEMTPHSHVDGKIDGVVAHCVPDLLDNAVRTFREKIG